MKKQTLALVILVLFGALSAVLAAEIRTVRRLTLTDGAQLVVDCRQVEGTIEHNDRLALKNGPELNVIFNSEGRAISDVLEADLDQDGKSELLVIMNLGGSADYREFSLLKNINGKYKQIWEESGFSGGKVYIDANRVGFNRPVVVIDYFKETKPPIKASSVFFMKDGKMIQG